MLIRLGSAKTATATRSSLRYAAIATAARGVSAVDGLIASGSSAKSLAQKKQSCGVRCMSIHSGGSGVEGTIRATSSDVVVVGGGVPGLALACTLVASQAFRSASAALTLIEGSSMDRLRTWSEQKQNEGLIDDWENRAIYLTEENRAWLSTLDIDRFLLPHRLGPVRSMHVTDGLTGAALDFDADAGNQAGLGTMVEISNLQQALLKRVEEVAKEKDVDVRILDGVKVSTIEALHPTKQSLPGQSSYVDAWPVVRLEDQSHTPIKARVLVGADGHNSPVRRYAGISAHGWPYDRMGVVATAKFAPTQEAQTAFQRFLPTGTLAWLPLSSDSASLVWTLSPDIAKSLIGVQKSHEAKADGSLSPVAQLIDAAFRLPWASLSPILSRIGSEIVTEEQAQGTWIGSALETAFAEAQFDDLPATNAPSSITAILNRSVAGFPLKLSHAESYLGSALRQTTFAEAGAGAFVPSTILRKLLQGASLLGLAESGAEPKGSAHGRTVLIGDAAHTIHPLAGQGLNLGLADARSLGETLIQATKDGADLGSHLSLQAYPRQRYLANQVMLSAVDHLHWLFVTSPPGSTKNSIVGDLVSRALVWGRSTGFEVLNELDIVKRAIIGAAGSSSAPPRPK